MTTPLFAITLLPIFCKKKREQGKDKTLIFTPLDCLFNDFISRWRAPFIVAYWIGDMIFAFSYQFIYEWNYLCYKYFWSTVRYFWYTKIVVFCEKRIALNRIESPRIFLPFFKIPLFLFPSFKLILPLKMWTKPIKIVPCQINFVCKLVSYYKQTSTMLSAISC